MTPVPICRRIFLLVVAVDLLAGGVWAAEPATAKSAPAESTPAESAPGSAAAPAAATAPADDTRMPEIVAAETLLRAGDIDGARARLAEAQKKNAHLAAPGVIVARWQAANGQLALARSELEQVIVATPSEPEPYNILGEMDWREGRIAEADLLFHAALVRARSVKDRTRRSEVEVQGHAGLAAVAESRKRWAAVRDELTAWLALDEKNPIPHQRLGYALYRLGKPEEAQKEFLTAAEGIKDFVPELAMATLYEESGDSENALLQSNAALKRLPKSVGVRLAIANRDLEHNRIAEAKRLVDDALKLDPDALEAKILAGGIARLQHDQPTAERYLESAHLQSPTNFAASNLLALTLADADDQVKRTRALEFAEQNLDKHPQASEAMATLGWVYFRLGRWDDASRILKRAMATGTLNADGAYFAAKMLQREGQTDDAKTLLTKALATIRRFTYQADAEKTLAQLSGPAPAAQAPTEKAAPTPTKVTKKPAR